MSDLIDDINRLLILKVGEIGRLNHIKQTLEQNKTFYASDRKYLQELTEKYLKGKNEDVPNSSFQDDMLLKKSTNVHPQKPKIIHDTMPYGWKPQIQPDGSKKFVDAEKSRNSKMVLIIIGTFLSLGIIAFTSLFVLSYENSGISVFLIYVWVIYGLILFVALMAWGYRQNMRNFIRDNSN